MALRWLQFRLRSLMALVAVVAVASALYGNWVRFHTLRTEHEKLAMEYVCLLCAGDGDVDVMYQYSVVQPKWATWLLPADSSHLAHSIDTAFVAFANPEKPHDGYQFSLGYLEAFRDLHCVELYFCVVDDQQIEQLARLPSLRSVVLTETELTESQIARLQELRPGLTIVRR
jgi:hypothetical protein